jgi:hypothetical protein
MLVKDRGRTWTQWSGSRVHVLSQDTFLLQAGAENPWMAKAWWARERWHRESSKDADLGIPLWTGLGDAVICIKKFNKLSLNSTLLLGHELGDPKKSHPIGWYSYRTLWKVLWDKYWSILIHRLFFYFSYVHWVLPVYHSYVHWVFPVYHSYVHWVLPV